MSSRTTSLLTGAVLLFFVFGVLFLGQNPNSETKLITVKVEGLSDQVVAEQVSELMQKMEGIQKVLFDSGTHLCTFRYDMQKNNLQKISARLKAYGFQITPLESADMQDNGDSRSRALVQIKITPASTTRY